MTWKETLGGALAWTIRRMRDPLGARKLVGPLTADASDVP